MLNQHPPVGVSVRTNSRLVCPNGKAGHSAWALAGLPPAAAASARPRLSTLYQVKGDQADAVLLLMPATTGTDQTLTAWLTGATPDASVAEARRVVYVALTRARRLPGLAIPAANRDRVLVHLNRLGIPAELR